MMPDGSSHDTSEREMRRNRNCVRCGAYMCCRNLGMSMQQEVGRHGCEQTSYTHSFVERDLVCEQYELMRYSGSASLATADYMIRSVRYDYTIRSVRYASKKQCNK
jgi:hypothetical protein